MDVLVKFASDYGFVRLNSKLGKPIVFHCVPGAGKSHLIRKLIEYDSRFRAYTLGEADQAQLSGVRIQALSERTTEGPYDLLDEYCQHDCATEGFFAVFGDPFQSTTVNHLRADFICKKSRRFGSCTAQLLRALGFDVEATGQDIVQIKGLYEVDPADQIIYFEEEVGCLLRRHGVEASNIREVIGKSFNSVTFVTAESKIPFESRGWVFQCLTRHRESLLILSPDASYTST
ncbi:triple gene block 1 protein [Phlox virus B]|uniref:Triple gene block 1 protein n=1 Tax=Phlox virus B TaxID=475777 RepID=A8II56_9VIRU|nr:triple gene block 1 protein [Phlox virus B]ABW05093.1 triple gene block 1 protein [Phlox virus B]